MAKVYNINNEGDKVPSIEYIQELVKMIGDELRTLNTNFPGFPSIKSDVKEIDTSKKEISTVSADKIKTNPKRRFVNEALLTSFANKPSNFEVEQSILKVKQELEDSINKSYMKIVNTPNAIKKLRDIAMILNEDEVADGLLNTLSTKINNDDFKVHEESTAHMNNNDRKALNILLKCLADGFGDWNAEEGAVNAIKNKPESLPANGGNAESICNHSLKDIINKDDVDLVIGTKDCYSKDSCDIYADNNVVDMKLFESEISNLHDNCIVLFKRGKYNMEYLDAQYYLPMIFKGADRRLSCINVDDHAKLSNATFKHICFENSTIYIKSDCELIDVAFNINSRIFKTNVFESSIG